MTYTDIVSTGGLDPRNTPAPAFTWRSADGRNHTPDSMVTRHLFFTLRMIWNHTMPEAFRMPGLMHNFGKFYTESYMKLAIRALSTELAARKDMTPEWQGQLDTMINLLKTRQVTV